MAAAQYWKFIIDRSWASASTVDVYLSELRLVVTPGAAPLNSANITSVSLNFTPVSGSSGNLYDDSTGTTLIVPAASIPGAEITFTLDTAHDIKEVRVNSAVSNSGTTFAQVPLSWRLQSSTDGVSYTTVQTASDVGFFLNNRTYSDVRNYRALIGANNSWMLILLADSASNKAIAELELTKSGTDLVQQAGTTVYATSENSASEGVDKLHDSDALTAWKSASTTTDAIYVLTTETDGNQIDTYSITAENVASPFVANSWLLLFTADGNDWQVVDARFGETFTQGEKKTYTVGATGFSPVLSQYDSLSTVSNGGYDVATPRGSHMVGAALLQSSKWYFEIHLDRASGLSTDIDLGLAQVPRSHVAPGFGLNKFVSYRANGSIYSDGVLQTSGLTAYSGATSVVIGVAYDAGNGYVWFAKDGVWINGGDPATGVAPVFTVPVGAIDKLVPFAAAFNDPAVAPDNIKLRDGTTNAPLAYSVPSGFKPITQAAKINISSDIVASASASDIYISSKDLFGILTSSGSATSTKVALLELIGSMSSAAAAVVSFLSSGSEISATQISSSAVLSDSTTPTVERTASASESKAQAAMTLQTAAELIASLGVSAVIQASVRLDNVSYDAWVVNLDSNAVSRYLNYNFNSMARIGDRYYAGSDGGVTELSGAKDGALSVDWSLYTGRFDFGSGALKRMKRAYLYGRSDGKLVLKVIRDDQTVDTYVSASSLGTTPSGEVVSMGRGAKAHYWQFELTNDDSSSDASIERLEVIPILLSRRVR